MDLERHSQSESGERSQRFNWQVQSEIRAGKQTDVKLCYASFGNKLLDPLAPEDPASFALR